MRAVDIFGPPPKRRGYAIWLAPFADLLLILMIFLILLTQFGDPSPLPRSPAETQAEERLESGP